MDHLLQKENDQGFKHVIEIEAVNGAVQASLLKPMKVLHTQVTGHNADTPAPASAVSCLTTLQGECVIIQEPTSLTQVNWQRCSKLAKDACAAS